MIFKRLNIYDIFLPFIMNIKSIDLRERVIHFIESGGAISEACRLFQVSSSSVYRWRQLKNSVGHLSATAPVRTAYKIDDLALIDFLEHYPDAYQSEIATHFNVTQSGACRAMKRLNITRKKRCRFIKNEMK